MSDRDYKILINVDTKGLKDGEQHMFMCILVDYLKVQLDRGVKDLPFKAEYHLSFSRNA